LPELLMVMLTGLLLPAGTLVQPAALERLANRAVK
jgi:hypothetical protein